MRILAPIDTLGTLPCQCEAHRFWCHSAGLVGVIGDPFHLILKNGTRPVKHWPCRHITPWWLQTYQPIFVRLFRLRSCSDRILSGAANLLLSKEGVGAYHAPRTCNNECIDEQSIVPVVLLQTVDNVVPRATVCSTTDRRSWFQ